MRDTNNNGATVSNPSPTPDGTAVIINSAHSGKHKSITDTHIQAIHAIL